MKQILLILGLVVALLAMAWVGAHVGFSYWAKHKSREYAGDALVSLGDSYRTLECLPRGDTNGAIELLESKMDGDIMELGTLVEAGVDDPRHPGAYVRALKRMSDYRVAHPRKTKHPEIDEAVARYLARARQLATNATAALHPTPP